MSPKTPTTARTEQPEPALVPKLRFPEFRWAEGWTQTPLGRCLDYQQPTLYLVTDTTYSPAFKTPVLTAGKTFILGYTDETHGIFSEGLPVIIFDDFTTSKYRLILPSEDELRLELQRDREDIEAQKNLGNEEDQP